MYGKLWRDWLQTSMILSLALSLIVGEELAFYVILVMIDWAPYNRWRYIRMFNRLPKAIRMLFSCSVVGLKSQLDSYLRNIVDLLCQHR